MATTEKILLAACCLLAVTAPAGAQARCPGGSFRGSTATPRSYARFSPEAADSGVIVYVGGSAPGERVMVENTNPYPVAVRFRAAGAGAGAPGAVCLQVRSHQYAYALGGAVRGAAEPRELHVGGLRVAELPLSAEAESEEPGPQASPRAPRPVPEPREDPTTRLGPTITRAVIESIFGTMLASAGVLLLLPVLAAVWLLTVGGVLHLLRRRKVLPNSKLRI